MSITKDYVVSVRVHTDVGERFDKALSKLEKEANEIPKGKYVTMTVNKSTIIEDLIKQFSNDILGA